MGAGGGHPVIVACSELVRRTISVWGAVKFAMRAAIWRRTYDPPLVALRSLLAFAGLVAVDRVARQLLEAGGWQAFNPYGINAVIAWIALELAIAALFVRPAARTTALSAMFVLSVIADVVMTAISMGTPLVAQAAGQPAWINNTVLAGATYTLPFVWWVGAMTAIVGSLEQQSGWRLVGRIAGLWLALLVGNVALPYTPVFVPPDFDLRSANWWETLYAAHRAEGKPRIGQGVGQGTGQVGQIEKAQPGLLREQVARLTPSRKGETEFYTLAIAGWADQDVFIKEIDGALEAIGSVLPIKGRTVRLINRRDTVNSIPLANSRNFAAAVHAIGAVMDKDNDVFVLVMTSHGERSGFALQLPGGIAELTPQQVAAALDAEGIKNRVVIVSSCFSGIFVPPLANDNTIVITAADDNHTSFGCAPERDWTYFGDAFFHQSLHPGADFENAFDHARILIHGWEMMDQATPSNPQGSFGRALVAKLAPFFATNPRP